jgi:Cu-processing system permease protein
MTLAPAIAASPGERRASTFGGNLGAMALREYREALSSRWFVLYSIAFVALGLGVSYLSAASSGAAGVSGFGRTSAGLINLVILVVPLMAMTAGAGTIASDRERGMLAYLLAQPVSRLEVLLGKYAGLAGALLTSICLGFGVCAAVLAGKGGGAGASQFAVLVGLTFMLALSTLGVGVLISVLARKASVATGTAVFAWLALVFFSDLGMMAGTLAWRMRVQSLFGMALCNPCQVFKMWSLNTVDASLDVLGPAGMYATDTFDRWLPWMFGAALGAWIVLPLCAAAMAFNRRSPI